MGHSLTNTLKMEVLIYKYYLLKLKLNLKFVPLKTKDEQGRV